MAAVFDFLPDDESARRAAAIAALTLDGKTLTASVANAVQDIQYERTIEGASTVTLKLIDPDGELLDSGLFSAAVDLELPSPSSVIPAGQDLPVAVGDTLAFRLVSISTTGAILSLVFEDREVALLRAHKSLLRASRADVTRAEFVRSMVREVKAVTIRFWSPELHVQQPIAGVKDLPTPATKTARRSPGFGSYTPKVKGLDADRAQIRLLGAAFDTAISMKANRRVMIGLDEAMTQESVVHNDVGNPQGGGNPGGIGGPMENVGVLHQDARYWPASRDVARDVGAFLRKLIPVEKAHRDQSIGWCVDQVQRSYTVGTNRAGADYAQWEGEARANVNAYTGDASTAGDLTSTTTYRQRYLFRRGEPGAGQHRETTWEASGRLAAEVNFRRFLDFGVFHYVSDDYLRKAAPRMNIQRGEFPAGVLSVDVGSFDTGKPRRTRAGANTGGAEIRVEVLADVLEPPLGGVWVIGGYGPCDGRYLITSVRGSYLRPRCTVTISLPVPKLPEPAPAVGSRARSDVVDSGAIKVRGEDLAYPLGKRGTFLGGVKDHMARAFGNWQSDNAVDIGCPIGTKVIAVDDGTIKKLGGAYDGTGQSNPNGYNVTLSTKTYTWFYTHLSQRKPLAVGDKITRGQLLGYSGAANGVAHLHIASGNHAGTAASGDPSELLDVQATAPRATTTPIGKPPQDTT